MTRLFVFTTAGVAGLMAIAFFVGYSIERMCPSGHFESIERQGKLTCVYKTEVVQAPRVKEARR